MWILVLTYLIHALGVPFPVFMMLHLALDVQRDGGQVVMLKGSTKSFVYRNKVLVIEIGRATDRHKAEISETAKHTKAMRLLAEGLFQEGNWPKCANDADVHETNLR